MSRALIHSVLAVAIAAPLAFEARVTARAGAKGEHAGSSVLQRFLSIDDSTPVQYRALRRIDASNGPDRAAWMDVWTEADPSGFRYTIVAEGGSGYIRSKIFRRSLESEKKMYLSGEPDRAALTPENYEFAESLSVDGLWSIAVTPRRKDVLLIDGAIFLRPDDGDLVRLEGELAKPPSFWVREVRIVRSFKRIEGARLPVALEANANIRLAGKATMRMTYEYETVNGRPIGTPQPRVSQSD
jgi:hypothetical protein